MIESLAARPAALISCQQSFYNIIMAPKKSTPLGPRTIYLMNRAQISHVAASFYDVPLDPAGVKPDMLSTLAEAMIARSTSPEPACLAAECGVRTHGLTAEDRSQRDHAGVLRSVKFREPSPGNLPYWSGQSC